MEANQFLEDPETANPEVKQPDVVPERGGISTQLPQANLMQKALVLNYHNYQVSLNPKHKQSYTIRHFTALKQFSISRSSLNRWIAKEAKIKEDALKLSSRSRSMTKVRRTQKPALLHVAEFFKQNLHIIKCLEIYYIQKLLTDPDDKPLDKEIATKFNEFKKLFGESSSAVTGILIDNESWPQLFKSDIHYQISSIQDNLTEQNDIQKNSKLLIQEKERLQKVFADYNHEDIYEFSEVLLDIFTLFQISELNGTTEENFDNLDNEHQPSNIRCEPNITVGIVGNVTGTDFPPPLIVTNLLGNGILNVTSSCKINSTQINSTNLKASKQFVNEFSYDPEGLNRREIFRDYLQKWDTRLVTENRSIVLLLDTNWAHFGLGEHRLQRFQRIKLAFINARHDETSSFYQRSHLRMPFSIGLERLVKIQLKLGLFNKFYKDSRVIPKKEEIFKDSIGIINNVKVNYDNFIEKLKTDETLKIFYKLGFDGSRIFEPLYAINDGVDNVDLELQQLQAQQQLEAQVTVATAAALATAATAAAEASGETDDLNDERSKNLYGRLTTFVRPLIPEHLKHNLQFSDTTRKLVVKDYEQQLQNFVRTIVRATVKLNPKQEFDTSHLQSSIISEITDGHAEKKYNKQYTEEAIKNYVRMLKNFEIKQAQISALQKDDTGSTNSAEDFLKKDLAMDKLLLNEIQPFLYKSVVSNTIAEDEPKITNNTYQLFNQFYASYVNDTAVISTKHKYGKRKTTPNGRFLEDELYERLSRKKAKLNKYVNNDEFELDDTVDPALAAAAAAQVADVKPEGAKSIPEDEAAAAAAVAVVAAAASTAAAAVSGQDADEEQLELSNDNNKFVTSFSLDSEEEATNNLV